MRVLIYLVMALSFTSLSTTSFAFDVDGDGKEGLAESIHALQVVAGMNPATPVHCNAPDEVLSLGKCWKDRNLGAIRIAESSDDSEAYGDLYQWGRPRDGHQHRTSGTEPTYSAYDDPEHNDFITDSIGYYDWRDPRNLNLWQGLGGINNPCPQGFRLPTIDELNAERQSWGSGHNNAVGAFASPLKLVLAGYRSAYGGLAYGGSRGNYWSSTIHTSGYAHHLAFTIDSGSIGTTVHARGLSVRCIKDLDYSGIVLTGVPLGDACTSGNECLSGNCVDGVCCNSSCASVCESCDLPSSVGICGFIPFGNDPEDECTPGTCDGIGACVDTCTDLIKNLDETDVDCGGATCVARCVSGQECLLGGDCISGICSSGLCI